MAATTQVAVAVADRVIGSAQLNNGTAPPPGGLDLAARKFFAQRRVVPVQQP